MLWIVLVNEFSKSVKDAKLFFSTHHSYLITNQDGCLLQAIVDSKNKAIVFNRYCSLLLQKDLLERTFRDQTSWREIVGPLKNRHFQTCHQSRRFFVMRVWRSLSHASRVNKFGQEIQKQASVIKMLSPIVDNTTATSRHTGDYAIIARLISYAAHSLTVHLAFVAIIVRYVPSWKDANHEEWRSRGVGF